MRDLEGALEVEKSAVDEAKHNLDTLTKQHRFVQRIIKCYMLSNIPVITAQ